MRQSAMLVGLMVLAVTSPATSQPAPSDYRDLVGGRAATGEAALASRGFVQVGQDIGDDRRWTYWWNARRNLCLTVTTVNGRYDAITVSPAPDCRRPPRPTTLPGPVAGPVASGRSEQIRFDRGATSVVRRGQLTGYETMTYLVDLRAGQPVSVGLQTSNRSGYFNVTAPRSEAAFFNGSVAGLRYQGRAQTSGRYKIEVYLMRNAARRGETMRYTLDVGVRP